MASYPDETIINIIKQIFDFDISKADLNKPENIFVCKIYSYFLQDFGMNINILDQIPMNAPSAVSENEHLYHHAQYQNRCAKIISWLMNSLKSKLKFSIRDIITPDPVRTRKFFSLLLHFYEFMNNNMDALNNMREEIEKRENDFETVKNNIKLYESELARKRSDNVQYEMEINNVKENISESREKLVEMKERIETTKCNINKVKSEITDDRISIADMNQKLLQLQQEKVSLLSQVIFDNELKQYEAMQADENNQKVSNEEIEKKIKVIENDNQQYKHASEDLEKLRTGSIIKIEKEIEKKLMLEKEYKSIQNNISSIKESKLCIDKKVEKVLNEISSAKAQVVTFKQSGQDIIQAKHKELECQKRTLILLKEISSQEQKECEQLVKDIEYIGQRIQKEKDRHDLFMEKSQFALIELNKKENWQLNFLIDESGQFKLR